MRKLKQALRSADRRINRIWEDQARERETARPRSVSARQRLRAFSAEHRWELLFVLLMGCLLFALSWILPFDEAPDEKLRYLIPSYIYRHGTLPVGWDPEIRSKIWGISYGFQPILPYIFGGWLMRLTGLFSRSDKALLMAARSANILFGMGFYWYVLRIGKRLFRRRLFRGFFTALLALLPQLLYLFVYVNTDAVAVFSSAMLIFCWLDGIGRGWDRGSCTRLAAGVAVCALSYFNAYGYALFSIVIFVGSLAVLYAKRGAGYCVRAILKRGAYVSVLVFILAGWWFIRSAVIYDGDILGMAASDRCAEEYAQEEYRPSVRKSVAEQGIPLSQMLRADEGGMKWIESTYRSTIGVFGYMKYYLGLDIYRIHIKLFVLGMAGLLLFAALSALYRPACAAARLLRRFGWSVPDPVRPWDGTGAQDRGGPGKYGARPAAQREGMHPMNFCLLQFSLVCCIIIPILLSVYYSYTSDFQAQGRYIMPMAVPMAYFITAGIQRFLTLFFRRWMVYVMMVPLFYAVLHVFLAAFVSVYIPTFAEPLESWSQIRFQWVSGISLVNHLIYLLIPG